MPFPIVSPVLEAVINVSLWGCCVIISSLPMIYSPIVKKPGLLQEEAVVDEEEELEIVPFL